MRPVRTEHSNLRIVGGPVGTGVGDLHAERSDSGWIRSVWQPTPEERQQIAAGANVALFVAHSGQGFPPVALELTADQERPDDAVASRLLASISTDKET